MLDTMRKIQVLIVDDSDDLRKMLRTALTLKGYEVLEAENGRVATQLAIRTQPDIILLDIMMPGMDGLDVCRLLRKQSVLNQSVIIFLTGAVSDREIGLEIGADGYLTKPFSPSELMRVLKKFHAKRLNRNSNERDHRCGYQNPAAIVIKFLALPPIVGFAVLAITLLIARFAGLGIRLL